MNADDRKKFWWKGEPVMVGSLRWHILLNDILQEMKSALIEYRRAFKKTTTL